MNVFIFSILRAVLAAAGGAGLFSDGQVETVAGGIAVLVTVLWSYIEKKYLAKKSDEK